MQHIPAEKKGRAVRVVIDHWCRDKSVKLYIPPELVGMILDWFGKNEFRIVTERLTLEITDLKFTGKKSGNIVIDSYVYRISEDRCTLRRRLINEPTQCVMLEPCVKPRGLQGLSLRLDHGNRRFSVGLINYDGNGKVIAYCWADSMGNMQIKDHFSDDLSKPLMEEEITKSSKSKTEAKAFPSLWFGQCMRVSFDPQKSEVSLECGVSGHYSVKWHCRFLDYTDDSSDSSENDSGVRFVLYCHELDTQLTLI